MFSEEVFTYVFFGALCREPTQALFCAVKFTIQEDSGSRNTSLRGCGRRAFTPSDGGHCILTSYSTYSKIILLVNNCAYVRGKKGEE